MPSPRAKPPIDPLEAPKPGGLKQQLAHEEARQRLTQAVSKMDLAAFEACFRDYGPLSAAWTRMKGTGRGMGSASKGLAHWVAQNRTTTEGVVRTLVGWGLDLDEGTHDANRQTALHALAVDHALEQLTVWLDAGANPNVRNAAGQTPLGVWSNRRLVSVPVGRALIDAGATVDGVALANTVAALLDSALPGRYAEQSALAELMLEIGPSPLCAAAWDEPLPKVPAKASGQPLKPEARRRTAREVLNRLLDAPSLDPHPETLRAGRLLQAFLTAQTLNQKTPKVLPSTSKAPRHRL